MRKLLFILFLFLFLIFIIISLYNTFTLVSKQRMVKPVEKEVLDEEIVLKHLTGALRIPAVSNPIDSLNPLAFEQMQDYLELSFRQIYSSPNIERQKTGGKNLLYKWVGRNPKLKPLLVLGQMDVKDPLLEQIPLWTYNPFLGKVTDGYIYGAGTMGGKSASIAFLEALEQKIAAGILPERTLYFALLHDMDADSAQAAAHLAQAFRAGGLEFEAVLGMQSCLSGVMQLPKPIAFVHCAERHRVKLSLEADDLELLTGVAMQLQKKKIPIARKSPASNQLLLHLLPELPLAKRWIFSNWAWLGWISENELRSDSQLGPMLNSTCEILRLEKSTAGNKAVAELCWHLSPDYSMEYLKARFETYLKGMEASWHTDSEAGAGISPDMGYAYEALHTTVRQVIGDVYVMPGIAAKPTEMALFKDLSKYCYQFRPYFFDEADFVRINSGVDQRISVQGYFQAIRFYGQLLNNLVL